MRSLFVALSQGLFARAVIIAFDSADGTCYLTSLSLYGCAPFRVSRFTHSICASRLSRTAALPTNQELALRSVVPVMQCSCEEQQAKETDQLTTSILGLPASCGADIVALCRVLTTVQRAKAFSSASTQNTLSDKSSMTSTANAMPSK